MCNHMQSHFSLSDSFISPVDVIDKKDYAVFWTIQRPFHCLKTSSFGIVLCFVLKWNVLMSKSEKHEWRSETLNLVWLFCAALIIERSYHCWALSVLSYQSVRNNLRCGNTHALRKSKEFACYCLIAQTATVIKFFLLIYDMLCVSTCTRLQWLHKCSFFLQSFVSIFFHLHISPLRNANFCLWLTGSGCFESSTRYVG